MTVSQVGLSEVVLIDDVKGFRTQWVSPSLPRQVGVECVRKSAEHVLASKPGSSVHPWFLLEFLL